MTRAQGSGRRRANGHLAPIAVSVGLSGLAVAVRALPWPTVLTPDGVMLASYDAFYHLRRIAWGVLHFPAVLGFDRYLHFPQGARPIWSPAFDWMAAALVRPLLGWNGPPGDAELQALSRLLVWAPPLLGGACVAALTLLAWRHFGAAVGSLAGLTLACLPAHFWYSQIGFVDHHAAVALVSTLALAAALELLRGPVPGIATAVATGASLALCLLVWPGSLLHVGLLEGGVFAHALLAERPAARAGRLALAQLTAFVLLWPLCAGQVWPQWDAFSPLVLSDFQPWLFAVLAAFAAACALLWRSAAAGSTAARRAGAALGVGALLLMVSLLARPELWSGAGEAFRWLARRESFQSQVGESQPLLAGADAFALAARRLSLFVYAAPLAIAIGWRAVRGRPEAARVRLLLAWCAGLLAATLAQRRFFNSWAVGEAWLFAWSSVGLARWLGARGGAPQRAGGVRAARAAWVVALLCAGLMAPALASYRPALANLGRWLGRPGDGSAGRADSDARLEVGPAALRRRATVEMARWMRVHTPETRGWLDPALEPEYGVLAPWEAGHVIEWEARRPTLIDNFGDDLGPDNFALAQRIYASSEAEALPLLERLRARYVVVGADASAAGGRAGPDSLLRSLYGRDGAELSDEGGEPRAPAARRHRLVFESPPGEGGSEAGPLYKVFERVPGARLEGKAPPGSRIGLSLVLTSQRKRVGVYRASAVADAAGRYAFRLPYATQRGPTAVRTGRRVHLRCGGRTARVVVPEQSVLRGERVAGPDLCAPVGGPEAPPPAAGPATL